MLALIYVLRFITVRRNFKQDFKSIFKENSELRRKFNMRKNEVFYIGPTKILKATTLGWCKVTPGLMKALSDYCRENGEQNRSAVVRRAIRKEIGLTSVQDIIESELPFLPRPKKGNTP